MAPIATETDFRGRLLKGFTSQPDSDGFIWVSGEQGNFQAGPRAKIEQKDDGGIITVLPDVAGCNIDFPELVDVCSILRGGDKNAVMFSIHRDKCLDLTINGIRTIYTPQGSGTYVIFPHASEEVAIELPNERKMIIQPDGTLIIPLPTNRTVKLNNVNFTGQKQNIEETPSIETEERIAACISDLESLLEGKKKNSVEAEAFGHLVTMTGLYVKDLDPLATNGIRAIIGRRCQDDPAYQSISHHMERLMVDSLSGYQTREELIKAGTLMSESLHGLKDKLYPEKKSVAPKIKHRKKTNR